MKTTEIKIPKGCNATIYQDGDKIVIEYEEALRFKRGDFVYWSGNNEGVRIILDHCDTFSDSWKCANETNITGENISCSEICLRPATENERQQLLDALHAAGKDWNAEKMEIVDWVWRPKYGDVYYIANVNCEQKYIGSTWNGDTDDVYLNKVGIVFKTKSEAIACTERMLKAARL